MCVCVCLTFATHVHRGFSSIIHHACIHAICARSTGCVYLSDIVTCAQRTTTITYTIRTHRRDDSTFDTCTTCAYTGQGCFCVSYHRWWWWLSSRSSSNSSICCVNEIGSEIAVMRCGRLTFSQNVICFIFQ